MTTDELRAKFEAWYVENAFDYPSNPIGSRECGLQWKAYKAAYASRDAEVEANKRAIPDDWELFCCQCFASESSGSWDHVVVGSFCTNCCGNGTAFPLPKAAIESIRNQASWVGKRYYPHKEDAEIEALRKDAERYRWLRNNSLGQWEHPIVVSQTKREMGMLYVGPLIGIELDKDIDDAMRWW